MTNRFNLNVVNHTLDLNYTLNLDIESIGGMHIKQYILDSLPAI